MRIFVRILAGLFILLWIVAVACYIYIGLNGRELVVETLSEMFHKPVQMSSTYFLFPFGLRINDLKVGEKMEVMQVKDVQMQIGVPDFFNRRFHFLFMSLSEPVLNISRTRNSKMIFGNDESEVLSFEENKGNPARKQENLSHSPAQKNKKPINFIIDYLTVEKGEIKFRDFSREKKFELILQDINLKAQNAAIPFQPVNTKFDLTASIFKENPLSDLPFSGSRIESRGGVNFYNKDMQAKLDVVDSAGKVSLSAQLDAKDNELTMNGKVHISNLIAEVNNQANSSSSLKDLIFSSLQSSGVEIVADFHSKTKMDDFHLDAVTFNGNLGYKPVTPQVARESPNPPEQGRNIGEHFEGLGKKFYKENVQEQMNKEVPAAQ